MKGREGKEGGRASNKPWWFDRERETESFLSSFFALFRVQSALARCSFCVLWLQHVKNYAPEPKKGGETRDIRAKRAMFGAKKKKKLDVERDKTRPSFFFFLLSLSSGRF